MVELRDVSYRIGDTTILDGVSVSFRPNRFNVVLGPNGAGKSTLLRIAAGLLQPTAGEATMDGRPVRQIPTDSLARQRAVLSQHVELAFPLPVADVVMMGRYPHFGRAPSPRDHAIVASALALVGMAHKREQSYPTLSGGEQQKVQLARVLAQIWNRDMPHEPRLLFLDEPTSSLDVHYQLHLLAVARELLAHDCTVVAVLHDLNVAFQYGDHFFFLDEGHLALETAHADEVPATLLERIFGVRARLVRDPEAERGVWRFSL